MDAMTVLIVDDEEGVRETFAGWLVESDLGVDVLQAADAESAILIADERPIDLALLDWNLGHGSDGLQLLQDLYEFQPDITAILITGFAHQATPLDALRMGVRDYLDKNQRLNRDVLISAVRRQLNRIAPVRREREIHRQMVAFREAIEEVLPVIRSTAALNETVPLPEAVRDLFRFVIRLTRATDGVLIVRQFDADRGEQVNVYDPDGRMVPISGTTGEQAVPFSRSLAASILSMGEPSVIEDLNVDTAGVELQPFERGRRGLLACPVPVGDGVQAVVELFDAGPPNGFRPEDRLLVAEAARLGADLLRQALSQRHTHRMLLDAIAAALDASQKLTERMSSHSPSWSAAGEAMGRLREQFGAGSESPEQAEATVQLAEAIRELSARYGPVAQRHCTELIRSLQRLLDETTGSTDT